jgi:hypothetical protein
LSATGDMEARGGTEKGREMVVLEWMRLQEQSEALNNVSLVLLEGESLREADLF